MNDLNWTEVMTSYDESQAEVIRIALAEEGIPCTIENAHQGGFTGVFQARVLVPESFAHAAEKLLEAHKQI
ncbi:DUF2007 domain-containing protein [Blastopirellula sp. JC732]|uniref:DUF2007 domain-containing protein n=1 Tax=Blastopirellula sediminis TaxID=2894196 RepID=A0A9X1MR70_9BACT|nr:DUF2007 domain-containing protein [Blastopirellula sediminis]MCC9605753.1 DUF2007 domain-containing protein [Blastopirellula sediminis]MCC9630947.1 DUF2007 domain-containing protein [Blastopirellula sediminis]